LFKRDVGFGDVGVKGVEVVIAKSPKPFLISGVYLLVMLKIRIWLKGRLNRRLIRHGLNGYYGLVIHHELRVHELFGSKIGIGLKIIECVVDV
jgi:hypothetical protein